MPFFSLSLVLFICQPIERQITCDLLNLQDFDKIEEVMEAGEKQKHSCSISRLFQVPVYHVSIQ